MSFPLLSPLNKKGVGRWAAKVAFQAGASRTNLSMFFLSFPSVLHIGVLFRELFLVAQGVVQRVNFLSDHAHSPPDDEGPAPSWGSAQDWP